MARHHDGPVRVAPRRTAEAVVQALLNAHRDGTLAEWLQRHHHIAHWLARHLLPPLVGAGGDALRGDGASARAVAWLLRWAVGQLRPDRAPASISRESWLSRTSWRPMLSASCHYGFEPVPAFRDRYHSHADEAPASQLCGLWSVGPSTYYRYLDKAKRMLVVLLRGGVLDASQRLALRGLAQEQVWALLALDDADARRAWHERQVAPALTGGDAASALWHLRQAGGTDAFIALLERRAVELANQVETEGLIEAFAAEALTPRQRFALLLAHASIWRMRGVADREQTAYEQALQIAADADDALMLGRVYGALGRFHEPRDADRAFAFFQDCSDCLWRAGVGEGADGDTEPLVEEFVVALVRLAWSHVLRNDPRSKAALDRAEGLRNRHALTVPALAKLEKTWSEYWRRAGDLPRALEYEHRALNLHERALDSASVLRTYSNLSLIYGEAKDFPRAIAYSQRVLALAETTAVEPELVASTHLNLGAAYFWQNDYTSARVHYELALDLSMKAQLRFVAGRAHYNLAEVAYVQFKQSRDPADEQRGDRHAAAALTVWPHESDPAYSEATKKLKGEILGADAERSADRLAPQEAVLYPAELADVRQQRELLAVPGAPEPHVRAHLRIANAYLAIAMKEREAALALAQRHGLGDRFAADIGALHTTFERELTLEQQLTRQWAGATGDLLSTARCQAVLARLLAAGSVNKSSYAELCGLSPATASKHLVTLAQRGLLMQTGKGPSTRYLLQRAEPTRP